MDNRHTPPHIETLTPRDYLTLFNCVYRAARTFALTWTGNEDQEQATIKIGKLIGEITRCLNSIVHTARDEWNAIMTVKYALIRAAVDTELQNIAAAVMLLRVVAGKIEQYIENLLQLWITDRLPPDTKRALDINHNGRVDIGDMVLIMRTLYLLKNT